MLVLSRGRDESICIGNSIAVTVLDLRGDKVRLGVTAPRSVPVHREEVAARLPPVMSDDAVHEAVLHACLGHTTARLPDVSLERMLAAHAAVAAEPSQQEGSHRVTRVACEPRLIAAVYAVQQWGGVEPMLAALGYDVSTVSADV